MLTGAIFQGNLYHFLGEISTQVQRPLAVYCVTQSATQQNGIIPPTVQAEI